MNNSDDSGSIAWFIFALGPGTGIAIWMWIQAKYRNKSARYKPESTVAHTITNVVQEDTFTRKIVSRSRSVNGRNERDHHERARVSRVVKG
ncbi:MAG: hypothetical protein CVT68_03375 [Actinobacteria bacterium HGW-Actinobacteria-8]|nr:MAG: hypothetical protein CVT68_03375 [Actinobacteria bacterium HGW-Actinobacteria-8]